MRVSVAGSLAAAFLLLAAMYVHGLLAWLVCAPLVLAYPRRCGWCRAALIGGIFGLTVAVGGDARWVASAAQLYFHLPPWPAVLTATGLAVVFGGGLGVSLGITLRCALRLPRAWAVAAVGATWATWESLVITVLPYYPWVSLAATQARMPTMLQIASVVGQTGLSSVIAAGGAALGLGILARLHREGTARYISIAVAVLVGVAAFGSIRLASATAMARGACPLSVVDAGITSPTRGRVAILRRYRSMTRRALRRGATIVVWPESALPGNLETDVALQREVRQLVGQTGAMLIAGGPRTEWTTNWEPRLFNSVYQIGPAGVLHTYDKRWLVPFAEYWPQLPVQRPAWLATEEVTAGVVPGVFAAGRCRLGILICFEVEQPALARALVQASADALLVLSNDAELPPAAVRKEIVQAQLRAVETGLAVIRAANNGASVVVDRYGTIRQRRRGGILTAAPMATSRAAAVTVAPLFGIMCCAATGVAIAVGVRR